MKKKNDEITLEDIHTAAALMGPFQDDKGRHWRGLELKEVRDTQYPKTKAIVLKKTKWAEEFMQLYLGRHILMEPHDLVRNLDELRDQIKARIKQSSSHYVEERKKGGDDAGA
jgi:hypothetical protein